MTGALLGHANPRSTAIYAHIQLEPMRQASERVGKRVANALGNFVPAVASPANILAANDA